MRKAITDEAWLRYAFEVLCEEGKADKRHEMKWRAKLLRARMAA